MVLTLYGPCRLQQSLLQPSLRCRHMPGFVSRHDIMFKAARCGHQQEQVWMCCFIPLFHVTGCTQACGIA